MPDCFLIPWECAELSLMQVTSGDYYERTREQCETLLPLIREHNPGHALDLGCGLGRAAVYLKDHAQWTLADYDRMPDKPLRYGWRGDGAYNRLDCTRKFCTVNGLLASFVDLGDPLWPDVKFDLVLSLYSVGFHWPIQPYLGLFERICADDCLYIFQVEKRRGDKRNVYRANLAQQYLTTKGLKSLSKLVTS